MNLNFVTKIADAYVSNSQKARVLTEKWVLNEIYCPSCGYGVSDYENNKPVADFYCKKCAEDFELKSKKGKMGNKVSAGAYSQMVKRINSPQKPNFFFMGYLVEDWKVNDFFVVPKHFFVSEIIEERKPLAESARRAGWVGSNILFSKIPKAGQIFYIENGKELSKKEVLEKWQKTVFLKQIKKSDAKGWILDIMNCIDSLNKKEFTLQDVYNFEKNLSVIHPENKNIKPKIRQQLQFLRDKNYLEFIDAGKYRLV
ncbi:MAG: restriction endonuclease [Candidatus Pacebacteria bacterium]|jgi:type II restriction enzyme|nr:restriction endonuclease [Candidatus Paceibacterota bacterium]